MIEPSHSKSKILLSVKILLSPVSAKIINSWERCPPIGPVSAAIGIAESSNLLNVFKYEKYYAVADEKFNKDEFEERVSGENRLITKGIEVGHIFYFGDKYSRA